MERGEGAVGDHACPIGGDMPSLASGVQHVQEDDSPHWKMRGGIDGEGVKFSPLS